MFGATPFGSSTFGSNTSAFGSTGGTTFGTSTGFGTGTGTSLFGAKTTGTTFGGFGTPTQAGTGLFGNTGTTGIFGSTPSAFGTATTQSTTGFGGFGTSTPGAGLFGNTATTTSSLFSGTQNTFGSTAKPAFGATTNTGGSLFGTPAASGTGLFGAKTTGTGGLFNTSTTGGLFGSTATAQTAGTPAKFVPQQSTDNMMKNGISSTISTKHQCITLMKEYGEKSLEELRMEDYQLGRKGPQATGTTATTGLFNAGATTFGTPSTGLSTGFGTSAFGAKTGTSLFGQQAQTGTTGLFGAKPASTGLFGNTSTTLGAPSAFSSTSSGLFGAAKPGGLFGATTTQPTTGLFGSTPAFGAATSGTGIFGTSGFGQTAQQGSLFGATSQPSTGLFGTTPAFGTSTAGTGTSLFGTTAFGQTAQPSLFGAKSSAGTLGTAFGTTNTGGLLGAQSKPFGFGTTNTFGTSTTGSSLFGNTGGTGLFGNTSAGLGFGAGSALQSRPLGSTLGTTFGPTGFGTTGTGLANLGQVNVAALQQQQQLQQQLQQHVFALTSSPFGDSPLFRNLTSRAKTDKGSVVTSQPRQRGSTTPSHYKVSPRPSARVKPRAIGKNGFSQARLFDGLDDENDFNSETFVPRRSIKKLVLKDSSQSSRSISSELANPSNVNGVALEYDVESEGHSRRESNASTEALREKMFSTPKVNGSLSSDKDLDKESPLVGVRFSSKITSEGVSTSSVGRRIEQETESPVVGVRQSTKTTGVDGTMSEFSASRTDEGVEVVDDGEHGPEPRDGVRVLAETNRDEDNSGCRVTLTRSEYYCNPSIDELNDMMNDNGEVIVGDFVVGREGYGMVKFFGDCNVTGLNLDEIVFFRRREIEVYPDSYRNKPPVGEGLNKKAEVTLYKVWPNDKTRRTPIKDPERLKMVGWLEKLETATARLGATFVDYQAETGTWIFTVDHFTRYGLKEVQIEMEDGSVSRRPLASLIEDKEKLQEKERLEKEQAMARKLRLEEEMAIKKQMLQEKMYEEESYVFGSHDDSQMTDISQETFPEFQEPLDEDEDPTSPASHHLATAMGVKSQRMQVMKASFFGESEEMVEPRADKTDLGSSSLQLSNRSVLSSTAIDELPRKPLHSHRMYSPVTATVKGVPAVPLAQSIMRSSKDRKTDHEHYRTSSQWYSRPQPILLPSVVGSPSDSPMKAAGVKTQPVVVPLAHSVTAEKHNLFADAGLTMGRSFRVGWGPAWTLIYGTTDVNTVPVSTDERFGLARSSPLAPRQSTSKQRAFGSFTLTCARVNPSPDMPWNSGVSQDQLSERLHISLANCERNEDDDFPYFSPISGVQALHEYAKVASQKREALASGPFSESAATFSSVLDLAVALWGNLPTHNDNMETEEEDVDVRDYNYGLARKEALSEWLSQTSLSTINQEIEEIKAEDNNHLRVIFSLLTARQISAACQVARENGDSRLAFLLAQASGTRTVRQWLLKQLEDWLEHKVDKFISQDRLKIYALLAGDMMWCDIQVCEDLDWKRTFSLHLWYDRPSCGLISDALQSYEDSFKGRAAGQVYAAEPRPAYLDHMEEPGSDSEDGSTRSTCRDTCYHLIKLFCKPSHRLENTLAPASYTRYQLDVSLSWHLYQILRAVGYSHLSEYHASLLNASYAAQLEAVGLWQWAVFVLLHIDDPDRREQVVRNLLVRYCVLDEGDEYSKQEAFLLDDLNVPVNWIHEAKVVRARMEKRPKEEAYHLLKSGQYNLSHAVILNSLASSAIINEEYDSIKELLLEIAPRENSSLVKDWSTGGQIYLDYIKLCEKFNGIKCGILVPTPYQLEKMRNKVASLCHRISELPSRTAVDKLCQSDMGTICANFLKIVAKELVLQSEPEHSTRTDVLVPHIQKLPLPEDCCLTELRELTSHYVDELAML